MPKSFDPLALFSERFRTLYGFIDPVTPTRSLSLCELFEQGSSTRSGSSTESRATVTPRSTSERKQVHGAQGQAVANSFAACVGGGGCLQDVICGVTVRMAQLDPGRGPGCDLDVRGWGIEGMWTALPAFATEAGAFLNRDFRARFGVGFDGWENICDQTGAACVSYPTPTRATGTYANGTSWTIDPFVQGCGNTTFPPNARALRLHRIDASPMAASTSAWATVSAAPTRWSRTPPTRWPPPIKRSPIAAAVGRSAGARASPASTTTR